ncbi:hypothetical protein C2845_PM17G10290 [Panicum miliaceum]|uniref:DNA-directed RNA polymerase n=1 Tax=Panicum miliaceum TaxID=4540 RepID=A0A3L6Q0B5_PANMI|nr:hypothetical protein C2845_PM17G10290 [Panicum miliaceum]
MGTIIEEDVEFVQSYYEMPDEDIDPDKISPWLLHIELDREMMVDKNLSMADIAEKINSEFDDDLSCIFSDDNANKLILRLRITSDEALNGDMKDESAEDDVFLKKIESNMLTEMALRGIPDINKVFIKEVMINKFDENGGFKPVKEVMLDTDGVNLLAVMCHEDVDSTRTTRALMRCSFEETVDILLDAAAYAESDYLKGVTENIMLGQLAPIGTGGCTLFLNDQMLKQVIELQLPSYLEGDFGMTPAPSPLSGTPYHEGMMSPSYLMSPDFRASLIDTNASFSPYVRHMALSPVPSQAQLTALEDLVQITAQLLQITEEERSPSCYRIFDAELQITQTHLNFSEHPLALAQKTASSRQRKAKDGAFDNEIPLVPVHRRQCKQQRQLPPLFAQAFHIAAPMLEPQRASAMVA